MNLADRMQPGSLNSKPNEMPKRQEIENTKNQSNQIQKLSSVNSTLRSKLREKSETIVSLNEEIARLNDRLATLSSADLILKENERLENSNKQLKQKTDAAMQAASISISAIKQKYQEKTAELQSRMDDANKREQKAQYLIDNESALIDTLAEENIPTEKRAVDEKCTGTLKKYKRDFFKRKKELEQNYRLKCESLIGLAIGGPIISAILIIIIAIRSPRFSSDFIKFFKAIGSFINDQSYDFKRVSIAAIIFSVIAIAVVLGAIGYLTWLIIIAYVDHVEDWWNLIVALASLIVIIVFADIMSISMNLCGLFLLINVGFLLIRYICIAINIKT